MNKNKLKIYIIFAAVFVSIVLLSILLARDGGNSSDMLYPFSQCLRDKGITMYGADWCSYCQNEKLKFGESFRFVPYVECPENPQKCLAVGIEVFPTWIFSDGKKLAGEQGLEKLSKESGCVLLQTSNN